MGVETAAAIAVAATVLAAGVGTYAAVASAQAQKEAADFNAEIASNQALAEQQKASFEAQEVRRRNMLRLGQQRALVAKSGITIESADDLIYDTALQGELEVQAALYGGTTASQFYQSKARLLRAEGANAETGGYLSAAGTALGGLGQAGSMSYNAPRKASGSGLKIR